MTYVCDQTAVTDTIRAYAEPTPCNYTLTVASARFCQSGLDCPEWVGAPAPPAAATPSYCRPPPGVVLPVSLITLPDAGVCPTGTIRNPAGTG